MDSKTEKSFLLNKIQELENIINDYENQNNSNPKSIRVLNLRGSQISDISILSELISLENISLSANQIKDIAVFKKLKNIRELLV